MHGVVVLGAIVSVGGGSAGELGDCVIAAQMTTPGTPHHVRVMVCVVGRDEQHRLQVHRFT